VLGTNITNPSILAIPSPSLAISSIFTSYVSPSVTGALVSPLYKTYTSIIVNRNTTEVYKGLADNERIGDNLVKPQQLFVYERDASRIELIIRIFYSIAIGLVLGVYGFLANICLFIQWFVILILGRRNESLSNFVRGYLEYAKLKRSVLRVHTVVSPLDDRRATRHHAKSSGDT